MEGSFLNLKKSIANISPEGRNYKAILRKINKTNKSNYRTQTIECRNCSPLNFTIT